MKKNKTMRIASVLLVAVLLTTCAISGTFAKYTTQDTGSDSARVAKWGVELQVEGNLFGESYIDTQVLKTDAAVAVQAVDKSSDVVAPGTKNEKGFTFSLKGQPEVAGKITSTMKIQNVFLKKGTYGVMIPVDSGLVVKTNFAEFTNLYYLSSTTYIPATSWLDAWDTTAPAFYTLEDNVTLSADYYPVVYSLAGNTASTSNSGADSLKAAADKIASQLGIAAGKAAADTSLVYSSGIKPVTFAPNKNLADLKLDGETLTWSWAFSDNDGADTILGMLENTTEGKVVKLSGSNYIAVVEYTDYCLDTMFSIDITVEQTDTYTAPN